MLAMLNTMSIIQNLIDNEGVYDAQKVKSGAVIAFDFGEQRVGVAMGEHLLKNASPLTTIDAESNEVRFSMISVMISEWQPTLLIVGLPLNLDGEETSMSKLCRKFARRLNGRFNLPVLLIDERFSSAEASDQLNHQGIRGRAQKPMIDQMAASLILRSYFDQP
jgi:putative holliday junction resolvase